MIILSKAVIYARYSSEAQSDSFSISAQLEVCRDYIKKQGWELIDEYIDEALSGTSNKRPSFQRMIIDASNKEFDRVVIYAYDRFSRNRYDQVTFKHELRSYGVYVVSVTQPIDHNNPDSVLLESIYEGMAESYSRKLARESVRGSVQAAKQGFWTGGYTPFGYKIRKVTYQGNYKSRLEVDELERPVVEMIFDMYLSGDAGFLEIAKRLNAKGLKPRQSIQKAKSAQKWSSSSVKSILTNQRYTGAMVWGKMKNRKKRGLVLEIPDVLVENCHPSIISKEDYTKVQDIIASRGPSNANINNEHFLFSGLIKCKCGHNYVGKSAKSGKYFYYVCNTNVKQGAGSCDSKAIPKDLIETLIIKEMKTKMFTASNIANVARDLFQTIKKMLASKSNRIKQIDTEIPSLQRKYTKLVDIVADSNDLDLADIAPRIKELKAEIDRLKEKRATLEYETKKLSYKAFDKNAVINGYVKLIRELLEDESLINQSTVKKLIRSIAIDYPEYKVEWRFPNPKDMTDKKVLPAVDLVVHTIQQEELLNRSYQEIYELFKDLSFSTDGVLKVA